MKKKIKPEFDLKMEGFKYLGRGPRASGFFSISWSTDNDIFYRCVVCGSVMCASQDGNWVCKCGSLYLDIAAGRFGSNQGDKNILVYKKNLKFS